MIPVAYRIVTPQQLAEGYVTYANGIIMRHAYRLVGGPWASADPNGNYLVYDPQPADHPEYEP